MYELMINMYNNKFSKFSKYLNTNFLFLQLYGTICIPKVSYEKTY